MLLNTALIHALPPEERRVFNRAEAASYVGVSPGLFDKLVADGAFPSCLPFGRVRRWDKLALDAALDSSSGFSLQSRPSSAPSAYDAWKNARG